MALFTVGKKKQDDRAQIPPSALKITFREIFKSVTKATKKYVLK